MGILHDKMAADLAIAGRSANTTKLYLNCARSFARYFMKSPAEMGKDEVRSYLLHLIVERGLSRSSLRLHRAALCFLYRVTLNRAMEVETIPVPRETKRLPVVLLGAELHDLWAATRNPMYRVIFKTMYSAGLRISEACALRPEQIEARRMVIRVCGKGDKDRHTVLSKRLLEELRNYYRAVRPQGKWMFPGAIDGAHISVSAVSAAFRAAVVDARITRKVVTHSLRHTFATHLVETGYALSTIQTMLGHAHIKTTRIYLHTSVEQIARVTSPFDLLGTPEGQILG